MSSLPTSSANGGKGSRRTERQNDIYVSTLRRFVSALGGELKLVASFPDKEVVISQFD
jgi:hypothetical protein